MPLSTCPQWLSLRRALGTLVAVSLVGRPLLHACVRAWLAAHDPALPRSAVLIDNFEQMAPIVYTPTVGWVCVNYHKLYRRPRGMFFSAQDRGHMVRACVHSHIQPPGGCGLNRAAAVG